MTEDEAFLIYIIRALANSPNDVSVKRTMDEKGVLLELTVAPEDVGRVIGKKGSTAQSLRTLLHTLGAKQGGRYSLKINDLKKHSDEPTIVYSTADNDLAELSEGLDDPE